MPGYQVTVVLRVHFNVGNDMFQNICYKKGLLDLRQLRNNNVDCLFDPHNTRRNRYCDNNS